MFVDITSVSCFVFVDLTSVSCLCLLTETGKVCDETSRAGQKFSHSYQHFCCHSATDDEIKIPVEFDCA